MSAEENKAIIRRLIEEGFNEDAPTSSTNSWHRASSTTPPSPSTSAVSRA